MCHKLGAPMHRALQAWDTTCLPCYPHSHARHCTRSPRTLRAACMQLQMTSCLLVSMSDCMRHAAPLPWRMSDQHVLLSAAPLQDPLAVLEEISTASSELVFPSQQSRLWTETLKWLAGGVPE